MILPVCVNAFVCVLARLFVSLSYPVVFFFLLFRLMILLVFLFFLVFLLYFLFLNLIYTQVL